MGEFARWCQRESYQLVEAYRDNREILCRRARVTLESGGKFTSYETWKEAKRDGESGSHLFFTGVGGVLYPPNSLAPQTTDAAEFMRLCPNNDDIWLNWMAALAGTRVRVVKPLKLLAWPGSQGVALWRINRVQGENDPQLTAMTAAYGLPSTLAQTPAMTG